MHCVPEYLRSLITLAFGAINDRSVAEDLHHLADRLYERAYRARLGLRTSDDNRPEHEPIVLGHTMRICWHSGAERASGLPFSLSEFRIAVAVSLLHDLEPIPRVTEEMIRNAENHGEADEATRLRQVKTAQRLIHMRRSAEAALVLLGNAPSLLDAIEVRQSVALIALHDVCKLGLAYPSSTDWLAVCCLEGDALWPLFGHAKFGDLGPLADLERKGVMNPTRAQLRDQAQANLESLRSYRANFGCTAEQFRDDETILRTEEGSMLLNEYRNYWEI